MNRFEICAAMIIAWIALAVHAQAAPLTIVENGRSDYCIYYDASSPEMRKVMLRPAADLQSTIEKATGVKLPIKNTPSSPMICLGVNASSTAAGVDKDLPDIGFRIVTKDKDLFILGIDDAEGQEKWAGMGRKGSTLGTYEFLERFVNARWLMPGDVGEDIPWTDKLVVDEINLQQIPDISYRWLSGIRDRRPDVALWKIRNRVDVRQNGTGVAWAHSFNSYPRPEMIAAHPEILAVTKDGKPVKMGGNHMMYCLSKPILYDLYAQCLIEAFDKNPKLYSMSMSPDEGVDFCQCPDCAKLTTVASEKWKGLGVVVSQHTEAVLNFYNEVAKRVRAKHPDRLLGGFIYQAYLVPLDKPIKMEPNIVFGMAINNSYGFKFYKPERAAIFQEFLDEWSKYGPEIGYYSYDTWIRNWFGLPIPPGRDMLKWNFPLYKKNRVRYLLYMGQEAWGYAGLHNWLVGRLMWNANADVDALFSEYLTRAYGPDAGPVIGRMYDLLDERLKSHIINTPNPDHEIDYESAKAIYGPVYLEIEKLYLDALTKTKTDAQKARLEMLGDNLVVANFNMRKAKLISDSEAKASPLYRGTDEIEEFIDAKEKTISIISPTEWIKMYRTYSEMPVLKEGWKPR